MAKGGKKEKVISQIVQQSIDYEKLIDDMNDVTFAFCIQYLHPVFEYHVMTVDDMRRIDLKEQLASLKVSFEEEKGKKQGLLNYYVSLIKKYFEDQLKCGENTRADRYKARAYELMGDAISKKGTAKDVEDYIVIFVSMFRKYIEISKLPNQPTIDDIENELRLEDIDLLLRIYDNNIKAKIGPVKINIPAIKGFMKIDDYDMKILYINSVIYLCLGLQERGLL